LTIEFEAEYRRPHLFKNQSGSYTVEVNGLSHFEEAGHPLVPLDNIVFLLPQNKKIASVNVVYSDFNPIPGKYDIEHGKTPSTLTFNEKHLNIPEGDKDEKIYGSDRAYPDNAVMNYSTQYLAGYSIGIVSMVPVVYNPLSGRLGFYSSIRLAITLEDAPNEILPLRRDKKADTERVKRLVENFGFISSYDAGLSPQNPLVSYSCEPDSSFRYVIITSSGLYDEFLPLAAQKRNRGMSCTIKTLESIATEYIGRDLAEKIRIFILDAFVNWGTEFVLLGGDDGIVPYRGAYCRVGDAIVDDGIPSDLYYSALDGDGNHNGNALWMETNDGPGGSDIDFLSDVFVGRCPANTAGEVSAFVQKVIAFESNPRSAWLENAVFVGEHLWTSACGDGWGGDGLDLLTRFIPATWTLDKLYERDGSFASTAALTTRLSGNVQFVNHIGHGNYHTAMTMTNTDVLALTNAGQPFIVYSQGCKSVAFDNGTSGAGSIGESFIRAENGAVAFIGNSRYGWGYPCTATGAGFKFNRAFLDAIFFGDVRYISEANAASIESNLGLSGFYGPHRWTALGLNVLGDPAIFVATPNGARTVTSEITGMLRLL
jgi:hypothetical protein